MVCHYSNSSFVALTPLFSQEALLTLSQFSASQDKEISYSTLCLLRHGGQFSSTRRRFSKRAQSESFRCNRQAAELRCQTGPRITRGDINTPPTKKKLTLLACHCWRPVRWQIIASSEFDRYPFPSCQQCMHSFSYTDHFAQGPGDTRDHNDGIN